MCNDMKRVPSPKQRRREGCLNARRRARASAQSACFRAPRDRLVAQQRAVEAWAATVVQCAWRGRVARKVRAQLRRQRRRRRRWDLTGRQHGHLQHGVRALRESRSTSASDDEPPAREQAGSALRGSPQIQPNSPRGSPPMYPKWRL